MLLLVIITGLSKMFNEKRFEYFPDHKLNNCSAALSTIIGLL